MRLISYQSTTGPRVAALRGELAIDLNRADPELPAEIIALLAQGASGLARAQRAAAAGPAVPCGTLQLTPPVPRPEKVLCVGLNYVDHAKEGGMAVPSEPVFFTKLLSTVSAPGAAIVLPRNSTQVDYEGELVVVIGRGGRHIARQRALSHVAAYCCGNDVSARDWQLAKPGKQWMLGKSFDTFAPFGPALVTADEIADPGALRLQTRLNGKVMQDSHTSQMIFPVDALIAYVSGVCTLTPGDLIFTGTPSGVGFARTPQVFLKPSDVVEVEIENLGILRNTVKAEEGDTARG